MNKTLIAMAVAGVMAAPMAAQADATIYGKIHVSVDSGDTGGSDYGTNGENKSSGMYFQSNSGRVGVKGSEDLGGGLKAVWQFESNASFGSGNTSFGGRNSYVGLAGGWGSFVGGKHDTPFKTSGRWFDLFGDQVGDSRNIIEYIGGRLGQLAGYTNWDSRPNNVLAYTSPTFGPGIDVRVAYVLSDATDNANALSAYGRWKSGDWLVGLGYEDQDNASGTSATGIRAGLQWSPGAWKMNLFYQDTSDNGGDSGADFSAMGAGVAYTMGKNVLKAQYYASDISDVDNANANTIAVGWDYKMSKRTTAYLAYAATSNDDNAYSCVDAGGHGGEICGQAAITYDSVTDTFSSPGVSAGDDPSVISVGMIHKF